MTTEEKIRRFENSTSCAKPFDWKDYIWVPVYGVVFGGMIWTSGMKQRAAETKWEKMSAKEKAALEITGEEDSYPYDEPDPIHN